MRSLARDNIAVTKERLADEGAGMAGPMHPFVESIPTSSPDASSLTLLCMTEGGKE